MIEKNVLPFSRWDLLANTISQFQQRRAVLLEDIRVAKEVIVLFQNLRSLGYLYRWLVWVIVIVIVAITIVVIVIVIIIIVIVVAIVGTVSSACVGLGYKKTEICSYYMREQNIVNVTKSVLIENKIIYFLTNK